MPERSIGAVSKTVVPLRVPRVRIPASPPALDRTANGGRSRPHARSGGQRSEQIALRFNDAAVTFDGFDILGQHARVFAAVAAAVDPDARAGCYGKFLDHGGRNRLLPRQWTIFTLNGAGLLVTAAIMLWNSGRRSLVADAPGST